MKIKTVFVIYMLALTSAVNAQEDGDDYPPIQEGWRCLEESDKALETRWTMVSGMRSGRLMQDEDCPEVTDEFCDDYGYYQYPCKMLFYQNALLKQKDIMYL